jgi:nitrate reductase cytochrome c-type subunit
MHFLWSKCMWRCTGLVWQVVCFNYVAEHLCEDDSERQCPSWSVLIHASSNKVLYSVLTAFTYMTDAPSLMHCAVCYQFSNLWTKCLMCWHKNNISSSSSGQWMVSHCYSLQHAGTAFVYIILTLMSLSMNSLWFTYCTCVCVTFRGIVVANNSY